MKKYQIIYADPPWNYKVYSKKGLGRSAESHYPTMSIEDICALPVGNLADKDCALFLWVTIPCLLEGLSVLKAWGFTYKTVGFVWVKQNRKADSLFWGMGYWTRSNVELCILATKGHPKRINAAVHQVIVSHIEEHSKKPQEARERIVSLMGDLPRIELFARQSTPGWDVWGNEVDSSIAPQSIENGSAYIFVNKELQRVTRGALDDLSDKGVIKKFPPCIASTHTALVLKEPKTKTSIRRVYLPKTVAYMLVERKKEIDELMDLFGDEYIDNNLVFCSSNGRPMESQVINRAFNKLIKENGLPHVVFHSLRHSSITYKLKLNGGDMKSVQGDSGHAQVKMVADVYSHIIDEDRCINAQRLEEAFYSSKTPDPVEDTEPKTADTAVTESDESDAAKILELLKNPETAALLKQLAKAL